MHGPVDGEVSRSSRSSPSIAPTLPRRADPDRPLLQGFRVRLRVEPDEQRPANPERRRPEAASGPKQEREQLRPGWPGGFGIRGTGGLPLATQISSTSLATASAALPEI